MTGLGAQDGYVPLPDPDDAGFDYVDNTNPDLLEDRFQAKFQSKYKQDQGGLGSAMGVMGTEGNENDNDLIRMEMDIMNASGMDAGS